MLQQSYNADNPSENFGDANHEQGPSGEMPEGQSFQDQYGETTEPVEPVNAAAGEPETGYYPEQPEATVSVVEEEYSVSILEDDVVTTEDSACQFCVATFASRNIPT